MSSPNDPYTQRTGYVLAANGENGCFCVFDRSSTEASMMKNGRLARISGWL
jgi:hypothetical protein